MHFPVCSAAITVYALRFYLFLISIIEPRWDYARAVSLGWIPRDINDDVKRQEIELCEGVYQVYTSANNFPADNLGSLPQTRNSVLTMVGFSLLMVFMIGTFIWKSNYGSKEADGYSVISSAPDLKAVSTVEMTSDC